MPIRDSRSLRLLAFTLPILCACDGAPAADEPKVGVVQDAISAIHGTLQHAFAYDIDNLDSVWVSKVSRGSIVSTYTQDPRTGFDSVFFSSVPGPAWFGPTVPGAGYAAPQPSGTVVRSANDLTQPWPDPENFCDNYSCPLDSFTKYATAGSVVAPGPSELVAAVTITESSCPGVGTGTCEDIAVTTSTNGGLSFDRSELISTGTSGGGEDGRFIVWDSVHATRLITAELGTMEQLEYSAPIIITWKTSRGKTEPRPEAWWLAKVLIEPGSGEVVVLNGPKDISSAVNPEEVATITLQAWHNIFGQETLGMVTSARRWSEELIPVQRFMEECPNEDEYDIDYRYSRFSGVWEPGAALNFEVYMKPVHRERFWRQCVGPSHSSVASANKYYVNHDRAAYGVHIGDGELTLFEENSFFESIAVSGTVSDHSRIFHRLVTFDQGTQSFVDNDSWIFPADEEDEEYLPRVSFMRGENISYGSYPNIDSYSRAGANALVRKVVSPVEETWTTKIRARAGNMFWFSGAWLPNTGATTDADLQQQEWLAEASEGISLGLTVHQPCIASHVAWPATYFGYEYFGACSPGAEHASPFGPGINAFFKATWAVAVEGVGIIGAKFEN